MGSRSFIIKQITLSGLLMSIALLLSLATFRVGGGSVYLVCIAVLMMPLFLRIDFAVMTSIASVVLADLINGWIAYTWISIVAYGIAVFIIWPAKFFENRWMFMPFITVGALFVMATYFFLEWPVFDIDMAATDLGATAVQFAIALPLIAAVYPQLKRATQHVIVV